MKLAWRGRTELVFGVLVAALALGLAGPFTRPVSPVQAATFSVSNLNDSGAGSLRAAIADANVTPGSNIIGFAVSGSINLTSGVLEVSTTDPLRIDATVNSVTVSGAGNALNGVFLFDAGTNVSLANISLVQGVRFHGGGIENHGTSSLTNVTFNMSISSNGGCIYNTGSITVNSSTISQCLAINSPGGFGGGIYNLGGAVTVSNSTIDQGDAVNSGGGVANFNSGTVTITSSTISNGIAIEVGGGVYNSSGTVTITNSTISGNAAEDFNGGGIDNRSTMTVTNSTISNNTASDLGGGIFNTASITLGDDIIAGNIAGLGANDPTADCRPGLGKFVFTNNGYNVLGLGTGCTPSATDRTVAPAAVSTTVLSALAANGGPTNTQALLPGSPAIDLVPASGAGCPATDQRGITRPQGPACDAGAFELVQAAPVAAATTGAPLPTGPLAGTSTTGCGSVNPPSIPAGLGPGSTVTLTATPCPGSVFVGWTGGPCNGTTKNPCVFSILSGVFPVIIANFAP